MKIILFLILVFFFYELLGFIEYLLEKVKPGLQGLPEPEEHPKS
jgi:hypothetical protein